MVNDDSHIHFSLELKKIFSFKNGADYKKYHSKITI
jgi:hypothetical protein